MAKIFSIIDALLTPASSATATVLGKSITHLLIAAPQICSLKVDVVTEFYNGVLIDTITSAQMQVITDVDSGYNTGYLCVPVGHITLKQGESMQVTLTNNFGSGATFTVTGIEFNKTQDFLFKYQLTSVTKQVLSNVDLVMIDSSAGKTLRINTPDYSSVITANDILNMQAMLQKTNTVPSATNAVLHYASKPELFDYEISSGTLLFRELIADHKRVARGSVEIMRAEIATQQAAYIRNASNAQAQNYLGIRSDPKVIKNTADYFDVRNQQKYSIPPTVAID